MFLPIMLKILIGSKLWHLGHASQNKLLSGTIKRDQANLNLESSPKQLLSDLNMIKMAITSRCEPIGSKIF